MFKKHICPNEHVSHCDIYQTDGITWVMDVNDEYDYEIEYCPYCGKYLLRDDVREFKLIPSEEDDEEARTP